MTESSAYYDDLETRDPELREAALLWAVARQIEHAKRNSPFYANRLAGIDPHQMISRDLLADVPVTRKHELIELQLSQPPFGGLATLAAGQAGRVFASPGPIHELETDDGDYWRMARAFHAAGLRAGDVLHNCFAYHLTPGGWIMDSGARALGCAVFPGGTGNSELQAAAIQQYRPVGFAGTPDFLKVILEKGDEQGLDCSSIKCALLSGGALFPQLREYYQGRGIATLQCYATADLGLVAYETLDSEGELCPGMVLDEEIFVEILRPGTGDPVPDGEVGEIVVTTFNAAYPLIRFATGDLSAILEGTSPCGRTNRRIKGWMGRADQTAKVKGMFVHPEQVAVIVKRHEEVLRARMEITRSGDQDEMVLKVEAAKASEGLADAVTASLQDVAKVKGKVSLVEPGTLPNDGKVIDDQRKYD